VKFCAAPVVCDGTSAVGESPHRIPRDTAFQDMRAEPHPDRLAQSLAHASEPTGGNQAHPSPKTRSYPCRWGVWDGSDLVKQALKDRGTSEGHQGLADVRLLEG